MPWEWPGAPSRAEKSGVLRPRVSWWRAPHWLRGSRALGGVVGASAAFVKLYIYPHILLWRCYSRPQFLSPLFSIRVFPMSFRSYVSFLQGTQRGCLCVRTVIIMERCSSHCCYGCSFTTYCVPLCFTRTACEPWGCVHSPSCR